MLRLEAPSAAFGRTLVDIPMFMLARDWQRYDFIFLTMYECMGRGATGGITTIDN